MTTLLQAPITFNSKDTLFKQIFNNKQKKDSIPFNKFFDFLNDKNTKANALLAYWGAETIIDSILATALFVSGSYFLAFLAFALAAYRTYAVLGVLFDTRF